MKLDASRLSSAFTLFVKQLLKRLELPYLVDSLLAMYSSDVREEAGLPPSQPWPFGCGSSPPSRTFDDEKESLRDAVMRDDAMAVDEAVGIVAKRFETYHHSLRPHYVCCYLENVLGLLPGFLGVTGSNEQRIGAMLDYAESCLSSGA